ncbi:Fur family transcriptional regulator [Bacillus piscicola]|uniref:Fur family transcriptional regulator n=1 Tax=Bacillus piscicola TaxID=1632684 RepID=UPI001F09E445|nr:Fur family transcriptional regulator [Bacillus piscicola]
MNVQQALEKLKDKGYKYTDKREMMLRLIDKEKRYMTAKEVLIAMQELYPHISFDTVYRNLSVFEEMAILEMTEFDGEKRYRFNCSLSSHHHHIICLECGKTQHIKACPMEWLEESVESQFSVTGHKFEIYGCCADCQAQAEHC